MRDGINETNGAKVSVRTLFQLFGPVLVVIGGVVSISGTLTGLETSVRRIESNLVDIRETDRRIIEAIDLDTKDGIRREIRLGTVERRIEACCPLWENGRRR